MSADNATFIQQRADQLWWVWDGSMSQELEGCNSPNATARGFFTRAAALAHAERLERDEGGMSPGSEYGIYFKEAEAVG